MLPLPKPYLRSPCEVKAMDNKPILMGHVSKIEENEIQISNQSDLLPVVHCNTTVKVCIFNSPLGFRSLVGKVYLSTDECIRISDVQSEADYEKRNFFRVRVELKGEAFLQNREGKAAKNGSTIPIQAKDLSLSGLFFTTPGKLNIDDRLSVKLNLCNSVVSLDCKVVRKRVVEQTQEDGYGCEFLDNAGPKGDILCKYLFDCQREQIRLIRERQI